jgi:hypothetical protein
MAEDFDHFFLDGYQPMHHSLSFVGLHLSGEVQSHEQKALPFDMRESHCCSEDSASLRLPSLASCLHTDYICHGNI